MANTDLSGIGVTQMRGSAGSLTYSRNQYGSYVKQRVTPDNPGSSEQDDVRDAMEDTSDDWRDMAADLQERWNLKAIEGQWRQKNRVGNNIHLSGRALYIKVNLQIFPGGTIIVQPPNKRTIIIPTVVGFVLVERNNPTVIDMTLSTGTITPDTVIQVWGTSDISKGITRPNNKWFRRIGTIEEPDLTATYDIGEFQEDRFEYLQSNRRVFFRIFIIDYLSGMRYHCGQGFVQS